MDARTVPRVAVDAPGVLVRGAVGGHRGAATLQARGLQHASAQDAARLPQEGACVGGKRDRRSGETRARRERLHVDMRPAGSRGRDGVPVGGHLVEPAAEHEDRVSVLQAAPDRLRREVAAHPEVARVVVREDIGPAPRGNDRHVDELGEADEVRRRARSQDAAAGEDHRPLGIEEEVEDPPHVHGVRRRHPGRHDRGRVRRACRCFGNLLGQEILGKRQQDRTRPAARGATQRLVHDPRQRRDVADLARPTTVPADRGRQVHLLERLPAANGPLHLADQRDDGEGIRVGDVQADRQVRRADGARREHGGRVAAERGGGCRHERRAAFVAGRDDTDAGAHEAVQERQEALSRDGVRDPDPGRGEGVGDEAACRPRCAGHGCPFPSGSWRTGAGPIRRARAGGRSPSGGRPCSWR